MFKSFTAALLVAASEAFIYKTDTTILGAVTTTATASTCQWTATAPASAATTMTVAMLQTMTTAAAAGATNDDQFQVFCSWQEAAAIWRVHIADYYCVATGAIDAATWTNTLYLKSVTTLPATADYAIVNKLATDATVLGAPTTKAISTAGQIRTAAAFSTFVVTAITGTVTVTAASMVYSLDATGKIFSAAETATYTGADEAAAKTVYDQALSGASATLQGVATKINAVELAKTQVVALVAGSLSNIVAAASAIAALSMAF
jgi:hypothetical protein